MEEKREVVKRETMEREFGDQSIYTILFTAGTALLMVGLKRAVMMFFIEQWRFWVFLVLNLVLLAIFFTSMRNPDAQNQEGEADYDDSKRKVKRSGCTENEENKEHFMYFSCDEEPVEATSINGKDNKKSQRESRNENQQESMKDDEEEEKEEEEDELELEPPRLSKEELHERVEAFISTFRQHLVLDARKGRELNYSNSFPGSGSRKKDYLKVLSDYRRRDLFRKLKRVN